MRVCVCGGEECVCVCGGGVRGCMCVCVWDGILNFKCPRNKAHDPIARYKRTLTIIYRLDYFHRQGKLDSFPKIFNTVMPLWMNKLVDLRSDPGKMEGLQDQFK